MDIGVIRNITLVLDIFTDVNLRGYSVRMTEYRVQNIGICPGQLLAFLDRNMRRPMLDTSTLVTKGTAYIDGDGVL